MWPIDLYNDLLYVLMVSGAEGMIRINDTWFVEVSPSTVSQILDETLRHIVLVSFRLSRTRRLLIRAVGIDSALEICIVRILWS